MPMMPREIIKVCQFPEVMANTVPMMTTTAASMIVRRRPIRSDSRLATAAPSIAPTERLAVMTPFSSADRCQCLTITTRMPAMTPRSYPNRMPPIAPKK